MREEICRRVRKKLVPAEICPSKKTTQSKTIPSNEKSMWKLAAGVMGNKLHLVDSSIALIKSLPFLEFLNSSF